jgi:hypothetical protein
LDSEENLGNNDQLFSQHSRRRKSVKGLDLEDERVTPFERLRDAARLESSGYLRVVDGDTDITNKHGIKGASDETDNIDDDDDDKMITPHRSQPAAISSSSKPVDNSTMPTLDNRVLYSAVHELLDPEQAERIQRQLEADLRELAQASPDDDQVEFAPPELTTLASASMAAAPRSAATAWYDIDEGSSISNGSGSSHSAAASRRRIPEPEKDEDEDEGAAALFRDDDEADAEDSLVWDEPLVELKQPAGVLPEGLDLQPISSKTQTSRTRKLATESTDEDLFDENEAMSEQGTMSSFSRILEREAQRNSKEN